MKLHVIAVYHNTDSRFFPYEPGHTLTQVISQWRHVPADPALADTANHIYHLFNADLDQLEACRAMPNGEIDFLIASAYRLLRRRSLSTGDAIAVTVDGHTTWPACDPTGWRPIEEPGNLTGQPLTAATVYQCARRGHYE